MSYDGNITPLLFGRAGMTARENRLLTSADELLDAAEVTFEDDYVRKGPGAFNIDTAGVSGFSGYTGTLSSSANWIAAIAAFPGSGIAAGAATVTATKAAGNTVCGLSTPVAGYATGSLVVVTAHGLGAPDNVQDAAGNTYTLIKAAPGFFSSVYIYASILTTGLTSGQIIQITYLTNFGTATVGTASNFTGITSLVGATGSRSGTGTAVSVSTSTAVSPPALLISAVSVPGTQTSTAGSSFTELADAVNGSGPRGNVNYRIDTSSPTIIGLFDWRSNADSAGAGTASATAGSDTVTGSGSSFTSYAPGDIFVLGGEQKTIESIASNTSLTVTESFLATHNAGTTYRRRTGPRIITATSAGNLFKDKPATLTTTNLDATTLKSGLSLFARPGRFVQAGKEAAANNRKLFYFNGVDPVQVLSGDGTTTAAISAGPTDWDTSANPFKQPINGVVHNARLTAWGNLNDPHRVYFSDPDNHEDFTTASAFDMRFASHIGDRIVGGLSYQGVLVIWKYPVGIFYLDDVDLTPTNWFTRTKSEALGCAPSPFAVCAIDEDVIFMTATGAFHMLSAVDTLGGLKASDLSYRLGISKWLRENVNLGKLSQTVSCWYPHKRIARFCVPGTGETENTLILDFDFSGVPDGKPVRFSYKRTFGPGAITLKFDHTDGIERPILGEGGLVYLMDQDTRAKDGEAYDSSFQTPHLDLAEQFGSMFRAKRKLWEHLELIMEPVSSGTLAVEVYVDGRLAQELTFDATLKRQRRKLNCGDGHTFSVKVTNNTVNEDYKVLAMNLYWKTGNEDASR